MPAPAITTVALFGSSGHVGTAICPPGGIGGIESLFTWKLDAAFEDTTVLKKS